MEDTCRLLNEGEKHTAVEFVTTWDEIYQHMSFEGGALEEFKEELGYKSDWLVASSTFLIFSTCIFDGWLKIFDGWLIN